MRQSHGSSGRVGVSWRCALGGLVSPLFALASMGCGLNAAGMLGPDATAGDATSGSDVSTLPPTRDARASHDASAPHDATTGREAATPGDGAAHPDATSVDAAADGAASHDATGGDATPLHDATTGQDGTTPHDSSTAAEGGHEAGHVDAGGSVDGASKGDAGIDAPPACTSACAAGVACTSNTQCASGYCTGSVCTNTTSCSALHTAVASAPSGAYAIQPTGAPSAFSAYCDMTDQGGGWTLVLKAGTAGSPGTFDYTSAYWTNTTLLNPDSTDMSQTEAKFQSYLSVPFGQVLAMMVPLAPTAVKPTQLPIPLTDTTSLAHLIGTAAPNATTTTLGVPAWKGLTSPNATIQPHCNMEGVNVNPVNHAAACTAASGAARVRIGLIANDLNDCCSPDSYIGFGGEYDYAGICGAASYSAGSMGGSPACTGGANVQDFGYLFVK